MVPSSIAEALALGSVEVDLIGRRVRDGAEIRELTALEARLLGYLAAHPGVDVAREELLTEVWGYAAAANTRAVDFAVKRLRGKLGDAGHTHLLTAHGIGYRLALGPPAPVVVEATPQPPLRLASGSLDLDRRRFTPLRGPPVGLSVQEAALLELLAGSPGFVDRERIERCLWRRASPNVYLALVNRVRRKVGDAIVLGRGQGARLERVERRQTVPPSADRFVDRVERAEAWAALARGRAVTLKGPAGVGKTRLALELARQRFAEEPGLEVWWVPLASALGAASFLQTVGRALGLGWLGPDAAAQLGRVIADRPAVLVVLDNFEQLLDQTPIVAGWMAAAPDARFLITSRRTLPLAALQVELGPLSLSAATELFVDRATAACPGVTLDQGLVTEIVTRIEGLPLALELAATRAEQLPFLAANLDRRLDVLIRAPAHSASPHSTLRGALDWSWDLIAPAEREALLLLGQFRGIAPRALLDGFDPAAHQLCSHSLAREVPDGIELSDTVRLYARERLALSGDGEHLRRVHAERVTTATEAACRGIGQADRHQSALHLLRLLGDDLRALVSAGLGEPSLDAGEALFDLLLLDGPLDGLADLLTPLAPLGPGRPRILGILGESSAHEGRFDDALLYTRSMLEHARTPRDRLCGERLFASILRRLGRQPEALQVLEQSCATAAAVGARTEQGMCLNNLANLMRDFGRYDEAHAALAAAQVIARERGDLLRLYKFRLNDVGVLGFLERWEEAWSAAEEAWTLAGALDSRYFQAQVAGEAAAAARALGRDDEAQGMLAEAHHTLRGMGCRSELVGILVEQAEHASHRGRSAESQALFRAAIEAHGVSGDRTEAWLLANQATRMLADGDRAEALAALRHARPLVHARLSPRARASFQAFLAVATVADPGQAEAHLAEALALFPGARVVALAEATLAGDPGPIRSLGSEARRDRDLEVLLQVVKRAARRAT